MELKKATQNQVTTWKNSEISLIQCILNPNTVANKVALIEYSTNVTLPDAINGKAVAAIKKENGEGEIIKALCNLINHFQEMLNVTNKLNEVQLMDTAITITKEYYYLKLEEIIYILNRMKTGKFGKFFNRLDVAIICECIEIYLNSEERAIYFEKEAKGYKKAEKERSGEEYTFWSAVYEKFIVDNPPELIKEIREGRTIEIRTDDYYQKLVEILPELTEADIEALEKTFKIRNYKDGLRAIENERNQRSN